MASNRLKERVNGIFIILDLINSFIYAMNGDLIPRGSDGAPINNSSNFGTPTYRAKDVYLKDKLYVGPEDADGYLKTDEDNILHGYFDDESVFQIGNGYFESETAGAQPDNTGFSALQTYAQIQAYEHINGTGEPIDADFPVYGGEASFDFGMIMFMGSDDGNNGSFFGGFGAGRAAQGAVKIVADPYESEHAYSCQSTGSGKIYLPPGAVFQINEPSEESPVTFGLEFEQYDTAGGVRQRYYFHNIEIIAGHIN